MQYWTKEELKFLTDNYMTMGNIEIGKNIGRTANSVECKLRLLGLKRPLKIREKMKHLNKSWNKGLTKETDERLMKMSKKYMGRTLGETWRKHISESHKGKKAHPNQRKAASEWTTANNPMKRPEISAKIRGKNNGNWKGGINDKRNKFYYSPEYNEWRRLVFKRDGYQCQSCLKKPSNNLNAHHIYKRSDYPELRLNVDNGITLCKSCHDFVWGKEDQFIEWCLMLQNENHQIMGV